MISATMHDDVKQADHMITRLSDLLRMLVRHGEQQEVPLAEEVNILHAYLDIMKGRFENRLQVHVTVDDADLVASTIAFATTGGERYQARPG
jgi:LytS/YehU family sensor histidine kinase